MAPNILLLLPMRRGLSPLPLNLGGFVSASTSGELPRLGYIGHALHLVLVQHFLSRHSFWMILHGTQTCCEKPMPTEWPCEGDVDNSSSWAQLWSHPSSGAHTWEKPSDDSSLQQFQSAQLGPRHRGAATSIPTERRPNPTHRTGEHYKRVVVLHH